MQFPTVSFQAPTDYGAEMQAIERQRKYADLLRQQGMDPLGPTEHIGGWAIRRSPMEGIGKMAQQLSGAYSASKADERQKALAEKLRGDTTADWTTIMQGMQGRPGVPAQTEIMPMDEQANFGAGEANVPINIPAIPEVKGGQINPAIIAQLRTPQAQQAAAQMYHEQMKPTVLGRSLVRPGTGDVLATDATWQQEQEAARMARLTEGDNRRREAEAAQSRQQQFLDAQARQAAIDRAELAKQTSADRAAMRQPPQVQPLVQVMGPNGPEWATREAAIGKVPAGVGSKAEKVEEGKMLLTTELENLRDDYKTLNDTRAIPSSERGAMSNAGAWIQSSTPGQLLGRIGGTKEQDARNRIQSGRLRVMNAIKNATGMSSQQLNSNVELQTWLSALTDPSKSYESNMGIIDAIENVYVKGGKSKQSGKIKFLGFE